MTARTARIYFLIICWILDYKLKFKSFQSIENHSELSFGEIQGSERSLSEYKIEHFSYQNLQIFD